MTQITSGNTKVETAWADPRMIRLYDPKARVYLHLDGRNTVRGQDYAWIGYKYQAKTLKDQAAERGDDWPFETVAR